MKLILFILSFVFLFQWEAGAASVAGTKESKVSKANSHRKIASNAHCYQSEKNPKLLVCFIGDWMNPQGEGNAFLSKASTEGDSGGEANGGDDFYAHFKWQRTTKNILISEMEAGSKVVTCDSGIEIKKTVLRVKNLEGDCKITTGNYNEI